jgi:hypothetical protein
LRRLDAACGKLAGEFALVHHRAAGDQAVDVLQALWASSHKRIIMHEDE